MLLAGVLSHSFQMDEQEQEQKWKIERINEWNSRMEFQGRNMGTRRDDKVMVKCCISSKWMEGVTKMEMLLSNKERNKRVKSKNGNGQNKILKLYHWNIGSRQWQRKIEDIEMLILEKDPDIFIVSEANLMSEITEDQRSINGYDMIFPNTMEIRGYARIVMLIKSEVEYKVLNQFMYPGTSAIWIQVGRAGRKPIRIGGLYREHTLLKQNVLQNNTSDGHLQLARWNNQLAGWSAAAAGDANCVMLGDINLDYLYWNNPENRILNMVDRTQSEIETKGFIQLVRGFTRTWPGQRDTAVDHIWTNMPNRIVHHSNVVRAGSDHNVVSTMVRLKDRVLCRQEVVKRIRKNMDNQRVKDCMAAVDWTPLLESEDIDFVNHFLESKILEVYNREAPLKKVQIRNLKKNWVREGSKKNVKVWSLTILR